MGTTLKRQYFMSDLNGMGYMFNKVNNNKKLIAVQKAE